MTMLIIRFLRGIGMRLLMDPVLAAKSVNLIYITWGEISYFSYDFYIMQLTGDPVIIGKLIYVINF